MMRLMIHRAEGWHEWGTFPIDEARDLLARLQSRMPHTKFRLDPVTGDNCDAVL